MKKRHAAQKGYERQAKAAMKVADKLRAEAHTLLTYGPNEDQTRGEAKLRKAQRKDGKVAKLQAKATKESHRAVFWRGRARALTKRIEGISTDVGKLEREIAKAGPHVDGNRVDDGDPGERFILAAKTAAVNCATNKRRNFYSQSGSWDCKHEIKPGPQYGERSDCSQFVTGICWSAQLPDPNGARFTGGYTGTLLGQHNGWKIVTEKEMRAKGWGIVVYISSWSDTVGHHTEGYVGEGGDGTIGHGSAPVDAGVVNLFGDGLYRCLIWEPKGK